MELTTKRATRLLGLLLTVVSFARVAVLFLESLAAVNDERAQDVELLSMCAQGVARSSSKMRSACLQAQAERASPVVLKAVLKAVSTAFEDFSESVASPTKLAVLLLFVVSSLFLPVSSLLRRLLPDDVEVEGGHHVVVLAHDSVEGLGQRRIGFKQRVCNALRKRGKRLHGMPVLAPPFDEENEMHTIELLEDHQKLD
jgi:hypothetical protein